MKFEDIYIVGKCTCTLARRAHCSGHLYWGGRHVGNFLLVVWKGKDLNLQTLISNQGQFIDSLRLIHPCRSSKLLTGYGNNNNILSRLRRHSFISPDSIRNPIEDEPFPTSSSNGVCPEPLHFVDVSVKNELHSCSGKGTRLCSDSTLTVSNRHDIA
jgi:hypothetical protein